MASSIPAPSSSHRGVPRPSDDRRSVSNDDSSDTTSTVPNEPLVIQESIESLSASLSDRIEFLAQELRARWRAGRRIKIEALGAMFDDVARNTEQLLDLIYHEILIREEFNDTVGLDEYVERFPQHAESLERLFAVHGALADDDWGADLNAALGESSQESLVDADSSEMSTPRRTIADGELNDGKTLWPRKSRSSRHVDPPPGYELLEEIGRGGMAVVFRARQQILNRIVALKMLLGGKIASSETLARMQQEARAVAQLQHPGIVQIHEVGEHQGLPYLSLEYVAGGTLHNWLRGRPLSVTEAAQIIEQLARTIAFAHERGIVHRDLKPANILLTDIPAELQSSSSLPATRLSHQSTPSLNVAPMKISDFGLARMSDSQSDLTATGQVLGTPSYMAPEQAAGQGDAVSPALDIYSLGAILYELLTGRPPFRGATLLETLEQVRNDDPVPPRQLQPRIPRDIETICLKCLEKTPSRRYESASAFANDLRSFINGESIFARPAGAIERCRKMIRKNPTVAALTSLIALLLIVGQAAILGEARRANEHEKIAIADSRRALAAVEEANAERIRAQESATIAEAERRKADVERTRALAAQAEAEASFERTLKAINSLAELGTSLQHQPGLQMVSKRLLNNTLALYDEFVGERADKPEIRRRQSIVLIGAGEAHRMIHDNAQAEKLLKQAATLLEKELQLTPQDVELHARAARASSILGAVLRSEERWSESLSAFEDAAKSFETAHQLQPDEAAHINGRINSLASQCIALGELKQFDEALRRYEQTLELSRPLSRQLPKDRFIQASLANVLHQYSQLLRRMDRDREATTAATEALTIREQIFAAHPNVPEARVAIIRSWLDQAELDRAAGNLEASISKLIEADEKLRFVVLLYADVYDNHTLMMKLLLTRLDVCFEANRAELGFAASRRVTEQLFFSLPRFPNDPQLLRQMSEWAYFHGELLWDNSNNNTELAEISHRQAFAAMDAISVSFEDKTSKDAIKFFNQRAWTFANTPIESLRNVSLALNLAHRVLESEPNNPQFLRTCGLAWYRSNKFAEAKSTLKKAIELLDQELEKDKPRDEATERTRSACQLILAMSEWRLGEHDQAKKTLELAGIPSRDFTRYGPEMRRLYFEAWQMMQPSKQSLAP